MSQHHLWLLCSCQGSKRHLDSVQILKEPEAVVFEFLLQIRCLIRSFNISVLLTFWAGSFFAVGAVLFIVRCSTAWLDSAHLVSVTASSVITKNVSRHFQMSAEWQITIVEKDYLLRWFSVATGHFCFHPTVQNVVTWPFLTVKEVG